MQKQKPHSNKRRSAFTLIEIMVSAVITVIMIGLVVQITSEVLKLWNRSVGKLSANAEARISLDLLSTDLEAAVFLDNGQQWLRVESETDVGSPTVGQTVSLKLFTPALDRPEGKGNICAVAYRLAYAPAYNTAKENSFILFRGLEEPEETFKNLLGSGNNSPQKELVGDFWSESSIVRSENFLAGNVVDFKIYIYGEEDGAEVILNDRNQDGEIDDDYIYGGTNDSEETPTHAEIFLTIVSDDGLELLSLPSLAGTGFDDVEDVVRQHGEVFKRRVYFQGRPF